ncbi:potassium/proton antiporter [Actinopolymorpha alba]|uniref:potassium/proton antiporter n=1 Tax=Actinopolymorpha alba TaxID=533267 RepID=UPI0003618E52|nr:potassium/proton antiporter [Actinopolymorpha alba]
MTIAQLDQFLLFGAIVLLLAVLAVRASVRFGLPSLLIYLAMGIALGENGLGVRFENAELAHGLGFAALVIILAEGGLTTRWSEVRGSVLPGLVLATVGVLVSITVVAVIVHAVLGFDWRLAFLLGAVTSPTDAAAVFSVLRKVPLPRRLSGLLEAESGLNDAPTVLLVTVLSSSAFGKESAAVIAGMIVFQLVLGTVLGFVIGWGGAWLLRRVALPASGLYPLAIVAFAVLAYAASATAHASGFAAVYVASLLLGNAELPHRPTVRSFIEGLAWLAQIGLFVMLGLLAWPAPLGPYDILAGLVAGVALTFFARPVSVFVSMLPFRMPVLEQLFLAWAGLRGAVPIVLATVPLAAGLRGAGQLFNIVFVLVSVFTLVQGPTLPWVAKLLRVGGGDEVRDLEIETAPLGRLEADLLEIRILPTSRLAGVEVGELRLPPGASVALVVRDGRSLVPGSTTVLRVDDDLLVVAPRRIRDATERRLRAVSRFGRLASWLERRS